MHDLIAELIDEESPDECTVRDDYTGRGCSEGTKAVVFDTADQCREGLLCAAFELGARVGRGHDEAPYDLMQLLQKVRVDAMGTGVVVY